MDITIQINHEELQKIITDYITSKNYVPSGKPIFRCTEERSGLFVIAQVKVKENQ